MDKSTITEIDISAILNTYVYMDKQDKDYQDENLEWILDNMPEDTKRTPEYQAVYEAVHMEGSTLGEFKLVSQSMMEGYSEEMIIACAFEDPSGNIYVSYRGTGDGKWVDNGIGICSESSPMQEEACAYFDNFIEN